MEIPTDTDSDFSGIILNETSVLRRKEVLFSRLLKFTVNIEETPGYAVSVYEAKEIKDTILEALKFTTSLHELALLSSAVRCLLCHCDCTNLTEECKIFRKILRRFTKNTQNEEDMEAVKKIGANLESIFEYWLNSLEDIDRIFPSCAYAILFCSTARDKNMVCLLSLIKLLNRFLQSSSRDAKNKFYLDHNPMLQMLGNSLLDCGDINVQIEIIEAFVRLTARQEWRQRFGEELWTNQDIISKFANIRNFEIDCRKFLNALNQSLGEEQEVYSLPAVTCFLEKMQLYKPADDQYEKFWIDFNMGSKSISIVFMSRENSEYWDILKINKNIVEKVTLAYNKKNKTLKLFLAEPLNLTSGNDDEGENYQQVTMEFKRNEANLEVLVKRLFPNKLIQLKDSLPETKVLSQSKCSYLKEINGLVKPTVLEKSSSILQAQKTNRSKNRQKHHGNIPRKKQRSHSRDDAAKSHGLEDVQATEHQVVSDNERDKADPDSWDKTKCKCTNPQSDASVVSVGDLDGNNSSKNGPVDQKNNISIDPEMHSLEENQSSKESVIDGFSKDNYSAVSSQPTNRFPESNVSYAIPDASNSMDKSSVKNGHQVNDNGKAMEKGNTQIADNKTFGHEDCSKSTEISEKLSTTSCNDSKYSISNPKNTSNETDKIMANDDIGQKATEREASSRDSQEDLFLCNETSGVSGNNEPREDEPRLMRHDSIESTPSGLREDCSFNGISTSTPKRSPRPNEQLKPKENADNIEEDAVKLASAETSNANIRNKGRRKRKLMSHSDMFLNDSADGRIAEVPLAVDVHLKPETRKSVPQRKRRKKVAVVAKKADTSENRKWNLRKRSASIIYRDFSDSDGQTKERALNGPIEHEENVRYVASWKPDSSPTDKQTNFDPVASSKSPFTRADIYDFFEDDPEKVLPPLKTYRRRSKQVVSPKSRTAEEKKSNNSDKVKNYWNKHQESKLLPQETGSMGDLPKRMQKTQNANCGMDSTNEPTCDVTMNFTDDAIPVAEPTSAVESDNVEGCDRTSSASPPGVRRSVDANKSDENMCSDSAPNSLVNTLRKKEKSAAKMMAETGLRVTGREQAVDDEADGHQYFGGSILALTLDYVRQLVDCARQLPHLRTEVRDFCSQIGAFGENDENQV